MALEVVRAGVLATVQDLGRPGLAEIGVGRSGAADGGSFRLANRLVANPEGAAAVEVTLGGFTARARRALTVAVTGAPCPVTVDGRRHGVNAVLRLERGQLLHLAEPDRGLRSYLAVRGGLAVQPVLGSRSTDVLAGLGPAPLRPGTVLPVGPPPDAAPALDLAPVASVAGGDLALRVVLGPRHDWFEQRAVRILLAEPFTVSVDSNRVGMRLDGPPLPRSVHGELPSEGMVPGAIQVPTLGRPTLFLADHPLTGGYPVIAVVRAADVDRAAQARPGQVLRFRLHHGPPRRPNPPDRWYVT